MLTSSVLQDSAFQVYEVFQFARKIDALIVHYDNRDGFGWFCAGRPGVLRRLIGLLCHISTGLPKGGFVGGR